MFDVPCPTCIGFKKDLANRLASHYGEESVCDSDSDSNSISGDGEDALIGVKISKEFVDDSGVMSSFTGEVMSRTKVGGEWLYMILYNDGDSEELTRYELVKHIEGADRSDSQSERDESESDSDYKE